MARRMPAIVPALALALAAGGCGGGGGEPPETARAGAPAATARIAAGSFPDHLDPQLAEDRLAREAVWSAYIPLLTYAHAQGDDGARVIPGLAAGLPAISDDGRTYALRLRPRMRYSDGRPIRASDFAYALERLFRLRSPGRHLYTNIVGARRFAAGGAGGISGIRTDDRSGEITIRLREPEGAFLNVLALPFAAPVPRGTPFTELTDSPPPASGPLAIARVERPRRYLLSRNPHFDSVREAGASLPEPQVERIEVTVTRPALALAAVERERSDLVVNPPGEPEELSERFPDRVRADDTLDTVYLWMSSRSPPFIDERMRQALSYAVDRSRIAELLDGRLQPGHTILPEGMPGHRGLIRYPGPDLAAALDLIAQANPADRAVTVWTISEPDPRRIGAYVVRVLRRLGLRARLRAVGRNRYADLVGSASTPDLDLGFGSWRQDHPHPGSLLRLLSGDAIAPRRSENLARVDIPEVDAELDRLAAQSLEQAAEDYGELDRELIGHAVWVPLGQTRSVTVVSERVELDALVFHPVFALDYTTLSIRR